MSSSKTNEAQDFIKKSPSVLRDQIKYCNTMLKALRRHPDSGPFLHPVDPIALNVPDYFDIIKNPMDLTTLQTQLNSGKYADNPDQFISDTRLIFSNCYTYNGINSQISEMAKALEKVFENMLKKMPKEGDHSTYSSKSKVNSHSSTSKKHVKKVTLKGELKFCKEAINEMLKKKYANINIPFLQPVDPIALGVPDYYTIITNPMDISTLKKKLESGEYDTCDQFESDCRLIFSNCYTYNHPDSEVYKMGKKLEEVFNNKWKHKPQPKETSTDKKVSIKKKDSQYSLDINNIQTSANNNSIVTHLPSVKIETNEYSSESDFSDISDKDKNIDEMEQELPSDEAKDEDKVGTEEIEYDEEGSEEEESEEEDDDDDDKNADTENLKREINQLQKTLQICTERLTLLLEKKSQAVARKAKKEKKTKLSGKSNKISKQKIPKLKATKITKSSKISKSKSLKDSLEKDIQDALEDDDDVYLVPSPKKVDTKSKSKSKSKSLKRKNENVGSDPELNKIPVITMEQKKELSESINNLPPEKLGEVVQIIQESMPLETGQEEIELDIDSFDPTTLYRLYRIVVNNKSDIPVSKRRKVQKSNSKQKGNKQSNKSHSNIDDISSSSSLSDSDSDSDDTGKEENKKKEFNDDQMKIEETEVKEKREPKKISNHSKDESTKQSKEEHKSSSTNHSSTPLIKNQQKSGVEKPSSLSRSNSHSKLKSTNDIMNHSQSQPENIIENKIEDISEYIDNYVAQAKNDKKQKEIEVSQRERNHDWRKSKLNELYSWNEKDLKVTPEMDEKRKKYIESLNQPVDEKMKWEHNKTLMQNFCRESDQFSLDNPGRIRTQLDKIKNSNLDIFPWMDSGEQ